MALIIVLTNQSGLAPVSDYAYEVLVGDGSATNSITIARGKVKGHERALGWQQLVRTLLDKEQKDAPPTD